MSMTTETPPPDLWAVVELMGHNRMAGQLSEQVLGGNFIRIDVPETSRQGSFSRLVNPASVYAINPVTETVARQMAERLQTRPLEAWDIAEMQRKTLSIRKAVIEKGDDDDND